MCAALGKLDRNRFAGVGVVPLDVADEELDRLVAAGMRGVRWNLVSGAPRPDPGDAAVRAFLRKLRERTLHLEVHLEGDVLAPLLPALVDLGVNIVVDHFGLPSHPKPSEDPFIEAVRNLWDREALYLKFSAPYRTAFDVRPHAEELLSLLPAHHVVWGSDWPHTRHEDRTSYAENFDIAKKIDSVFDMVAPYKLYGIRLERG
ncbi:amidohydrolase family protein [Pannonibacter sp. Pt2-lr]